MRALSSVVTLKFANYFWAAASKWGGAPAPRGSSSSRNWPDLEDPASPGGTP
jgi:hypothetical protein